MLHALLSLHGLCILHSFAGLFSVSWRLQEGVRTFSVRVGVKNVFWTCILLLEIAYAGALGVGLASQVRHPGGIRDILHPSSKYLAIEKDLFFR